MQTYSYLIIGSGIAGLNFALNAAEKEGSVLIITKKKTVASGTNYAQGGIAGVLDRTDNFTKHVQDTLVAGAHHNNLRAVEFMVKHGPQAIHRLIELGVPFATDADGELLLTKEGGHSKRRIAFVGDYTGQEIEKTLIKKVHQHPLITILEHTFATDLLIKNKRCYGVQAYHQKPNHSNKQSTHRRRRDQANQIENFYASVTVLATGGLGQIYRHTTNPAISTGDGLAMAARADLKFKDLEFIQFHPTALKYHHSPYFLISEAVRGEGAYLRNTQKQRFMKKYHHLAELAPRDIVARTIFEEEKKGPVYLDISHKNSTEIKLRFPKIYQKLKTCNLDLTHDLIPITPAAHYACGGIKVNLKGETKIKNLYAFGEITATGVHGANRLASNSLLEALVFSNQIIKHAIPSTKSPSPHFPKPKILKLNQRELNLLQNVKRRLKKLMWENVGIVRTTANLKNTLQKITELEKTLPILTGFHPELKKIQNMIIVDRLITQAAYKRQKSLGGHYIKKSKFQMANSK